MPQVWSAWAVSTEGVHGPAFAVNAVNFSGWVVIGALTGDPTVAVPCAFAAAANLSVAAAVRVRGGRRAGAAVALAAAVPLAAVTVAVGSAGASLFLILFDAYVVVSSVRAAWRSDGAAGVSVPGWLLDACSGLVWAAYALATANVPVLIPSAAWAAGCACVAATAAVRQRRATVPMVV